MPVDFPGSGVDALSVLMPEARHSFSLHEAWSSWFVVHTRSRHEDKVVDLLREKRIPVFLPKMQVWSRRRDRRLKVQVPLFRGYLFVNLPEPEFRWSNLLQTRGVVRVLGAGGKPVSLVQREVESILLMVASGADLHPLDALVRGDRVRVVDGPLAGVEGVVLRRKGKEQIAVSIDLLARSVAVDLNESQLERVGRPRQRNAHS
ncbi:MAG: UpxY family transcription antiterminator [Candidatus Tectomicrobia bacterium]|uniref:UpxY family transcription antiterminator n=1 Tax=Tectimicrobiota bacterium TaxID=2528274 RepID=A0A932HUP5_UNCTE|nr:UpxY family transcription antiterminator [Candidatus Tectomicrobia bacterium]